MKTNLEVLNLLEDDLNFVSDTNVALISPDENRNKRVIKRNPGGRKVSWGRSVPLSQDAVDGLH